MSSRTEKCTFKIFFVRISIYYLNSKIDILDQDLSKIKRPVKAIKINKSEGIMVNFHTLPTKPLIRS